MQILGWDLALVMVIVILVTVFPRVSAKNLFQERRVCRAITQPV